MARDLIGPLADISVIDQNQIENGFMINARGYDLGKILVATVGIDAYRLRRTPEHIRLSGVDHWLLSFRKTGSMVSKSGRGKVQADSGSLWLASLAYPLEGQASAGSSIMLMIEREHLLASAGKLDLLNHTVLQGITARIAAEFLNSMLTMLPVMTVSEIPIFVETALIILKGFAEQADTPDLNRSRPIMSIRLEMVKRYIHDNLSSSHLEPDEICAAMKLSRRQLYYLFEQLGGVSAYVRSCRLNAFHEAITEPAEDRPIHTVAAEFGFHDAALFSRQFKTQFGYSPREAREAKLLGYAPLVAPPKSITEWLAQVRCGE
ncbi:MAG: helix-turn-helix domain-containing protein [Rhizobiaceae bacterium]|nr:helix-turn-helix domain-containing protein [Rhizobiaceae bacterium]